MNALRFVIVSQSLILREGLFAFLRENSYSPNCITKLSYIEQFDRPSDNTVLILDDARQSEDMIMAILSRYAAPSLNLKIIVLSLRLDMTYIGQVVEHANTGFVYHADLEQHLFGVVDMLNLNMMSISPTALKLYLNTRRILELGGITDGDIAVLKCFADGLSVDDMVDQLGMSQRTIYRVRNKWREVLDVPTSDLIIDKARQLGML